MTDTETVARETRRLAEECRERLQWLRRVGSATAENEITQIQIVLTQYGLWQAKNELAEMVTTTLDLEANHA